MASTTPLYYDAHIDVIAAQAKAALPAAVNGRIEKAVRLVRSGSVELHEDGSAVVISESDGLTGYLIANGRCNCPDFTFQPPEVEGWCRHKIARALVLRLQRHAVMSSNGTLEPHAHDEKAGGVKNGSTETSQESDATLPVVEGTNRGAAFPLPEAPASATVRLTIAGHTDVLFTLRDHSETRLLARPETLLARFPVEAPAPPQRPGKDWCPVHHAPMKENHGNDGSVWYSHKTAEGWCKGKGVRNG
jgi:hypothetical protein